MSRTNEKRHIKWHETCKCICRLDAIVCNNKQRWNNDKCRCECKEWIDKGVCDKEYAWNPSNCECQCDKSCDLGEFLDYENFNCRKRLVDKLVEECTKTIDEVKIVSESKNQCSSCILYIALFSIFFTINVGIGAYFIYYKYLNLHKKMFLDMIMSIKQQFTKLIKWGRSSKLKVIIFTTPLLVSNIFMPSC